MTEQPSFRHEEATTALRQYAASQARGIAVTLDTGHDVTRADLNAFLEVLGMLEKFALMDAQARAGR